MKHVHITIFCLFVVNGFAFGQSKAEKFQELVFPEDAMASMIRNPEIVNGIQENCQYIEMATSWSEDLSKFNTDECALYANYIEFSKQHLGWIDEVQLVTVQDETTGMEVEEVHFIMDGKEVPAKSFLSSRFDACKGDNKIETGQACMAYFTDLALKMKPMVESASDLALQSDDMIKGLSDQLIQEIKDLKSSRKLSDVQKVKELKHNLQSVEQSGKQSSVILPRTAKAMSEDYRKIDGVTRTLKRLEGGL